MASKALKQAAKKKMTYWPRGSLSTPQKHITDARCVADPMDI
jgi:hypothetical protein